ncbi:MAG TPA: FtsQ-type POTRA domain-containing protein [Erysipelotrichaceae bacterium]|nr:FtsQ-type POTRA domain-containing protein [Erysipelotrichaceae bacterium]
MTNIPSVDELISESRNEKLKSRKKKIIKVLLTIIGIFIVVGIGYYYFFQRNSSIEKIKLQGNTNVTQSVVESSINSLKSKYNLLDFGFILSEELESNPLIKSLQMKYSKGNELLITIEEFGVLAYLNNQQSVLLENGKLYSFNEFEPISINELIFVNGYDDELAYTRLASSLNELTSSTKLMISEIIQDEKSYDVYYAKLIMYDGITVYTSLSTINVLEDYASIRQALNPEHACIAIDEIKAVPYSFSCYP